MSKWGIAVGVDGSAGAQEALHWACEEARLRGVPVTAIHAWDRRAPYALAAVLETDQLEGEARKVLDRAVAPWPEKYADVTINSELSSDSAAVALVEASKDADMVVVGSRGLGGFPGLLLGSVGRVVAQHAHCPVVVIRPRQ